MKADSPIAELAALFLRLGTTAFGGPAAHIAMMRDEVVRRRAWLTDAEFLDLLGATNLIPGPNSTEMAIHIGYRRHGWRGLLVAGLCFIVPACLMVSALAWIYTRYGRTPQAGWLLYGISPVIIAIIAEAVWRLGKSAVKGVLPALVGLSALALSLGGINELALLGAGAVVMVVGRFARTATIAGAVVALWSMSASAVTAVTTGSVVPVTLTRLALFFEGRFDPVWERLCVAGVPAG